MVLFIGHPNHSVPRPLHHSINLEVSNRGGALFGLRLLIERIAQLDLASTAGFRCPALDRCGPLTEVATASFDHLVGKRLEVHWHIDTDCRGSFEVDHEIELLWPLYR